MLTLPLLNLARPHAFRIACQKWLSVFEQLSPIYKWNAPGDSQKVQSCPRRRSALGDEPADAVGNSGRTRDFILRGLLQLRQTCEVRFVWRESIKALMSAMRVAPGQVVGNVGASRVDAVLRLQVHPLIVPAAPQALDEDVVSPGAASVHRQPAAGSHLRPGTISGVSTDNAVQIYGATSLRHARRPSVPLTLNSASRSPSSHLSVSSSS
jgi:hypothetical protein